MKSIDLTNVYKKYKGMWVTFSDSYKIISVNKDMRKAYDDVKK